MHSLLRLPINLSQIPFAWGVRYGVLSSFIPELTATAENCVAYLLSRSRIRYFGPFPRVSLPVTAAPSIHRLDISLHPCGRSSAFFVPSPQIHTIAGTTSRLLPENRRTRCFQLDSSRMSPSCGSLNVPACLSPCISGWFIYSLLCPVLAILLGSVPLPITDSLSPSLESKRSFQAMSLAYLAISAVNRIGTTHDASAKVYRAERYEGLVSKRQ